MDKIDGQVIMLIIFVVISAIKWFVEQVQKRGEEPHEISESLEDIYDEFREEILQRQTTVKRPTREEAFQPNRQTTPPPLPASESVQHEYNPDSALPPAFKVKKPKLTEAEKEALARIQEDSLASPSKKRLRRKRSHASLRQLLASPESARQAIIIHEVLGKPKSLSPH